MAGTLISGINSDLPGQIMAQVAQNVYDTPPANTC
jgi:type IV secretory pathway VirB10-like protein